MLKKLFLGLILVCVLNFNFYTQECGPGCPICSGAGSATSTLVKPLSVMMNTIWIPNGDEERGLLSMRTGITSWMDAGIGYAFKTKKLLWSLRIQPIQEDEEGWTPALILGTGSVQMGKSDQSVFVQLTKAWEFSDMFQARFSVGTASLLPDIEELYILYGVSLFIKERYSVFLSYDGLSHHAGISWFPNDWLLVSAMLLEMKEPALSIGLRLILSQ